MRVSRRAAGWMLVAYAILGFALVVLGAVVGMEAAARVERFTADADATLAAAAGATEAAAESLGNVDASLSEARASADSAGTLARDASRTFDSLASAMSITVLGTQPLLPLAAEFTATADQAAELADTLDDVAASLGDTRGDVARISPEMERLGEELANLGADPGGSGGAPPVRLFVMVLLAWLLIQAAGSLLAGLSLIRRPGEA